MSVIRFVVPTVLLLALLDGGCGGSNPVERQTGPPSTPSATATAAPVWTSGYPSSIAVLGHAGSTAQKL